MSIQRHFLQVMAVVLLLTTMFISTTAMAFPRTPHSVTPNYVPVPPNCISIAFFNLTKNGTNNFTTIASVTNGCGSTVTNGSIVFNINPSCAGAIKSGPSSVPVGFSNLAAGATSIRHSAYWLAVCGTCVDGKLVAAPPINISASAYATGVASHTDLQSNTAGPQTTVLSNSISASASLCIGASRSLYVHSFKLQ